MNEEELRKQIESALHIDWAFKGVNGKPDKIIVCGTPKGSYHTSYEKFLDDIERLITQRAEIKAYRRGVKDAWNFTQEGQNGEYDIYMRTDEQIADELEQKLI